MILSALDTRRVGIALLASTLAHAVALTVALPRVSFSLPDFPPLTVLLLAAPIPSEPLPIEPAARTPDARISVAAPEHERAAPSPRNSVVQRDRAPVASAGRATAPQAPIAESPAPPALMAPPARMDVHEPSPAVAAEAGTSVPAIEPPVLALAPATVAAALDGYGQSIAQVLARYRQYPRIAQLRGWEGRVTMRLRVAASGQLIDAIVQTSSGHDVLDRQAVAMARRAQQFPAPPAALSDREIDVLVPVVFRLEH